MKRVKVTKDNVSSVVRSITALVGRQVLIGIPERKANRNEDEGPINNAALGYIHENGSPAANIPARPFLVPGVQDAEDDVLPQLHKAADEALRGDEKKSEAHLEAAGFIGEISAKDAITNGDFVPLKPETIRARRYSRGTQSMRTSEKHYLELVADGMAPADAQSEAGIRPLINSGQLRNAITHVVRKK